MRAAGGRVRQAGRLRRPTLARGHFVPPTLIEIEQVADLGREVFGPVLHVLRWRRDSLPALLQAINGHRLRPDAGRAHAHRRDGGAGAGGHARGQRLRQPQHRRRGGRRAALRRRRPVGHRPQGRRAAVPAAPAGRAAAAGGAAGGGAQRQRSSRPPVRGLAVRPDDGLADDAAGEPLAALRRWAQAQGLAELAAQCDQAAAESPVGPWLALRGPTGEANLYAVRRAAMCWGWPTAPVGRSRPPVPAGGGAGRRRAGRVAGRRAALAERLPAEVRERIALAQDWTLPQVRIDAVLQHGCADSRLALAQRLAGAPWGRSSA
jgi:RHH-type proline utilization regulon transcriptional repressor/proline dehydrogenase/delta 1-pyrroline-5-carboxylate dehydrogenase